MEFEADAVPSYLQPEPEVESELNLPAAPSGGQYPPSRTNPQVRSFVSFCLSNTVKKTPRCSKGKLCKIVFYHIMTYEYDFHLIFTIFKWAGSGRIWFPNCSSSISSMI